MKSTDKLSMLFEKYWTNTSKEAILSDVEESIKEASPSFTWASYVENLSQLNNNASLAKGSCFVIEELEPSKNILVDYCIGSLVQFPKDRVISDVESGDFSPGKAA